MVVLETLLQKVKANLIIDHFEDDMLVGYYITAATSYAEGYQKKGVGYYNSNLMIPTTEQAVIMLSSHFYESRDGSTAGFYGDNVQASQQVWDVVNRLLNQDKDYHF